jgi:rhodanese-related sulfurtransferase
MDFHFEGNLFTTHAAELKRRIRHPYPPFVVVDIRPRNEYLEGHIPGAVTLTLGDLVNGLPEGTDARTEFFVVGRNHEDSRVRQASLALRRLGAHRVVEFTGGMREWGGVG